MREHSEPASANRRYRSTDAYSSGSCSVAVKGLQTIGEVEASCASRHASGGNKAAPNSYDGCANVTANKVVHTATDDEAHPHWIAIGNRIVIGVCVGGSLVAGTGFTGQVCVQGNLHSFGGTITGGSVIGSPSAGVSAGFEASNAHSVCELGSYFNNTTVSLRPFGEGPQGVGETGSGTLPGGRTVTYSYGGVGLGYALPPFASGSTGTTNTSTASVGSSCGC